MLYSQRLLSDANQPRQLLCKVLSSFFNISDLYHIFCEMVLVVSKKLLAEYYRTMGHAALGNNITVIINLLTQQGRLVQISNEQIKEFKQKYFTKKVARQLVSNKEDREHIPVVLLSDRKYALTLDEKFTTDLINFPGFTVTVGKKPADIPYSK